MKFEPFSEDELNEVVPVTSNFKRLSDNCFGTFTVLEATDQISKTINPLTGLGNSMIKLKLWVIDEHGGAGVIFDNLVFTQQASWKIKQFLASIDLVRLYKTGEIATSLLIDRTGPCRIKQKPGTDYFDIAQYIAPARGDFKQVTNARPPVAVEDMIDEDDCPF
jgi:hypothetical protein